MIHKATLTMFSGRVICLVYNYRERMLAFITDGNEVSIVHCAFRPMAERMSKIENAPLFHLN